MASDGNTLTAFLTSVVNNVADAIASSLDNAKSRTSGAGARVFGTSGRVPDEDDDSCDCCNTSAGKLLEIRIT